MNSRINVFAEGVRFPYKTIRKKDIAGIASKALELLRREGARITIIAADDSYIAGINARYRNEDLPTDVISFPTGENTFPAAAADDLGEIYLSLQTAEAQAREYDIPLLREIARLIVHGLLHCLGYDHEKSVKGAAKMEKIEEELLSALL